MERDGEISGFMEVTRSHNFRYEAVKALNESHEYYIVHCLSLLTIAFPTEDVSNELQIVIQQASNDTFVR
jgi:hypothetical protein